MINQGKLKGGIDEGGFEKAMGEEVQHIAAEAEISHAVGELA